MAELTGLLKSASQHSGGAIPTQASHQHHHSQLQHVVPEWPNPVECSQRLLAITGYPVYYALLTKGYPNDNTSPRN